MGCCIISWGEEEWNLTKNLPSHTISLFWLRNALAFNSQNYSRTSKLICDISILPNRDLTQHPEDKVSWAAGVSKGQWARRVDRSPAQTRSALPRHQVKSQPSTLTNHPSGLLYPQSTCTCITCPAYVDQLWPYRWTILKSDSSNQIRAGKVTYITRAHRIMS